MEKKRRKILKVKKYTIEVTEFDDDKQQISRTNDGFSALELMGVLAHCHHSVSLLLAGKVFPEPEVIKRNIVKD